MRLVISTTMNESHAGLFPFTLSVHKTVEQADSPPVRERLAGSRSSYKQHNLSHRHWEKYRTKSSSHRLTVSTTKVGSLD